MKGSVIGTELVDVEFHTKAVELMSRGFAELEACDGKIDPVTLDRFRRAIPQFNEFMKQAAGMFAPIDVGSESEGFEDASLTEYLPAVPRIGGNAC